MKNQLLKGSVEDNLFEYIQKTAKEVIGSEQLITIVSKINQRLANPAHVDFLNSDTKKTLLREFEELLKSNNNFSETETEILYALCNELCSLKGNPLGIISPKSSKEFQHWLGDIGISINRKLKLTDRMLSHLSQGDIQENLLKYVKKTAKQAEGNLSLSEIIEEVNDKITGLSPSSRYSHGSSGTKMHLARCMQGLLAKSTEFTTEENNVLIALCKELYASKRN